MVATVLYLLKTKPDMKSIAVMNQDYAWGRDSWELFRNTLLALKPDVTISAELFPKFGATDYSTEISRLQALRPDVILSTSWGGDLDTFVRQAAQRGLMKTSLFVLPLAESSLERLGTTLPDGVIVGSRGDHYFLHPEHKNNAKLNNFVKKFKELNLINNKHIPHIYLTSSIDQRLELLAGLIDSDGYLYGGSCIEIATKFENLRDNILFLCRSLGFSAYFSNKIKFQRH
jgi:ABC-type branched-subunit amino acid transport system substrate-binding protein